ncbi:tRNA specific adenosine deaminase [Polychytrium aggregatum]|uniref:tRNA specific adenosine deaminase n=1 Tax=Polychytrium aggregatum TaxID=110093 RepID=UPI0022FE33D3|nr:tRNA specific adenosine deaminase [Polychytrium aggregatum]KAI9199407.1 tRNA specific adenosine deaminase [Polychytrium aggregatum]
MQSDASLEDRHVSLMREALALAEEAYNMGEVPVGCVFFDLPSQQVIGSGRNETNETYNATRHAELVAIDRIRQSHPIDVLHDCVLYVTVEPCLMCASALRQLGIQRVYYGCGNDKFGGNGSVFRIHQDPVGDDPPYPSEGGFLRDEAIMMLRRFYVRENDHAPVPKKKPNRILKPIE